MFEFRWKHRERGNKIPKNAFHCVQRNAPDPKETKNAIDAEGVEILTHLREPLLPPPKAAFLHDRPIVSRKSPVLPFFSEWIRRGSRLDVHVIQLRALPRIRAVPVYAYRKIPL